jgi:hypothetical protein
MNKIVATDIATRSSQPSMHANDPKPFKRIKGEKKEGNEQIMHSPTNTQRIIQSPGKVPKEVPI